MTAIAIILYVVSNSNSKQAFCLYNQSITTSKQIKSLCVSTIILSVGIKSSWDTTKCL